MGRDVEYIKKGDVVSVPFNIACGRCPNCKRGDTGVCLNVNPARAGAAYGYVDMGGARSRAAHPPPRAPCALGSRRPGPRGLSATGTWEARACARPPGHPVAPVFSQD